MKPNSVRIKRGIRMRVLVILAGIALNTMSALATTYLELPVYLDTIGTICAAWLGGIFPGAMTAFFTNLICGIYNNDALYYSSVNIVIALYTVQYHKKHSSIRLKDGLRLAIDVGILSGLISTLIDWFLFGNTANTSIFVISDYLASVFKTSAVISVTASNILLNIIDKGLSIAAATFIIRSIPDDIKNSIKDGVWRQRPLSDEEIKDLSNWSKDVSVSSRSRMSGMLVGLSTALLVIFLITGANLYLNDIKTERIKTAEKVIAFTEDIVDMDRLEEFLLKGRDADGYNETEKMLKHICESVYGVAKLRVGRVEKDKVYLIFDLSEDREYKQFEPGYSFLINEESKTLSEYLLQAKDTTPIEFRRNNEDVLKLFYPVKDAHGHTGFYIGVEISKTKEASYVIKFLNKMMLLLAGLFLLLIIFVTWMTDIYVEYPIRSLARCIEHFAEDGYDQSTLDKNVMTVRRLGIRTGDEVERLYHALCKMTLNQAEQMRNVRRLSDSTAKMQEGIIITMADMVESRDSDTGAHVQKTAAYAKIIVEGLKKKGYYAEKITPKFMSDVVRSAPLHDVGKINISDTVLNKPGKLTDEEYEIMKTHTTAGKKIMETAISKVHGESYLREARNMAAYHHERWDGKGYPEGLHGEVIPLSARIMAVADVFDALASPRVYKPAFPLEKAISILQEGSGSQFDPKCVEVFLDSISEVKKVLERYNGEI
ncbi:MAG: HD domain-containing protein [Oribacterium sp.]|nr:HD domain-containing protein [Oribacterium sp.]